MQVSPFLRCFPYHRSPFQGTHGDRVAGDNTRSRHNLRHFSYYATSPAWQLRNRTPRILVLSVKSDARFARRRCGSCPVFEVTHYVYKCALNKFSFRAQIKNFVIASASVAISRERNDVKLRIYSDVSFPRDPSTTLRMTRRI